MAAPQQKVSFLLTGSVEEQQTVELKGPIPQQNGSPNLADSRNTRLSLEKGTCTRAPDNQAIGVTLPANHPAFGIVGNQRSRNYALYTTPDKMNRIVADDGAEPDGTGIIRDRRGLAQQNAYVPLRIARAGAIAAMRDVGETTTTWGDELYGVASAYNPARDELWVAWVQDTTGLGGGAFVSRGIYACAYNGEGVLIVSPRPIFLPDAAAPPTGPVGLTSHGARGTVLWCIKGDEVHAQTLTAVTGDAVLGTSFLIGGIGSAQFGVASDGGEFAYLATSTGGTTGVTHKIDVDTGTSVANATIANATPFFGSQAAVSYGVVAGAEYVAVAFASSTTIRYAIYDENLAVVRAAAAKTNPDALGPPYAQFIACPQHGIFGAVFARSVVGGYGGTTKADDIHANQVSIWISPFDGSPEIPIDALYHVSIIDRGFTWVVSANECYPLLFVAPNLGGVSTGLPATTMEVLDPQAVGYIVGPWEGTLAAQASPVARFGVVRGTLSPVYTPNPHFFPAASSCPRIGDEFYVTYRKADDDTPGRYVRLSVAPESLASVNDRDGIAMTAGALPVQWDGVETVEYGGPLTAPHLNVVMNDTPGTLEAGVYGMTCIYEWRDAAGLFHRSMPCPTITVTLAADGGALYLRALMPLTMRNGVTQEIVRVVLYMTKKNGTSYHAVPFPLWQNDDYVAMTVTEEPDDAERIIYSRGTLGEELVPQPPPPLTDIAIVGSRAWGIDAEVQTRIVYSKLRVAGIGFEWFPAGEVIVPSNAGDVIAIREQNGTLILFAERGIYQVSDGGPNNTGQGGSFGSPYKLSEVGIRSQKSVLLTPKGVFFLDNTGCFSVFMGGAVTQLPGARVDDADVVGSYLLEDAEEACFLVGLTTLVFNYGLMRWTTWDLPATPSITAQSAITRDMGLFYAPSTGRTYTVDSHVIHPTSLMRWETDWMILGGDFQDYVVVYDLLFNAYSVSPHGIRLELLTEYNGVTATTLREWTQAELAVLLGPTGRYTVRIEPVRQDARAFKARIQELTNTGTHRGCRPGSVTLVYSIDGLTYEESNIPGSHK